MTIIQRNSKRLFPIVIVYLGKRIPDYVFQSVDSLIEINKITQIFLIVDKGMTEKIKSRVHPSCGIWEYESNNSLPDNEIEKYHNLEFRNGYWKHTISRIIAFLDFQIAYKFEQIIHLEADVILMKNFPFEKVATQSKIIWGYYNEKRDVGALVFVPKLNSARWLRKEVINTWKKSPSSTDMEILKNIATSHSNRISYWPSGLSIAVNSYTRLSKPSIEKMQSREVKLSGIFDVAPFGMWLCGMDPSSNYGLQRYFSKMFVENGDSIVDPSHVDYAFGSDDSILVRSSNKTESIYTLHNHSKDTRYFKASRVESLHRNYRKYIRRGTPYQTFSPKVFQILVFRKFHKIIKNSLKRKATKYD
jgi:hypothetical protein